MATHRSSLAWKIPWTESLAGYSPWGRKESDTTKATKPPPERQQPGVVSAAGNIITNRILTSILMLIVAAAFQFWVHMSNKGYKNDVSFRKLKGNVAGQDKKQSGSWESQVWVAKELCSCGKGIAVFWIPVSSVLRQNAAVLWEVRTGITGCGSVGRHLSCCAASGVLPVVSYLTGAVIYTVLFPLGKFLSLHDAPVIWVLSWLYL